MPWRVEVTLIKLAISANGGLVSAVYRRCRMSPRDIGSPLPLGRGLMIWAVHILCLLTFVV